MATKWMAPTGIQMLAQIKRMDLLSTLGFRTDFDPSPCAGAPLPRRLFGVGLGVLGRGGVYGGLTWLVALGAALVGMNHRGVWWPEPISEHH